MSAKAVAMQRPGPEHGRYADLRAVDGPSFEREHELGAHILKIHPATVAERGGTLAASDTPGSTRSSRLSQRELLKNVPAIIRDFAQQAISALRKEGLNYRQIAELEYWQFSPRYPELWMSDRRATSIADDTRLALTVYRGAVIAHLDENPWKSERSPLFFHYHHGPSLADPPSEHISTAQAIKDKYSVSVDYSGKVPGKEQRNRVTDTKTDSVGESAQQPHIPKRPFTQQHAHGNRKKASPGTRGRRSPLKRNDGAGTSTKEHESSPGTKAVKAEHRPHVSSRPEQGPVVKSPAAESHTGDRQVSQIGRSSNAYVLPATVAEAAEMLAMKAQKPRPELMQASESFWAEAREAIALSRKALRSELDSLLRTGESDSYSNGSHDGLRPVRQLLEASKSFFERNVSREAGSEKNGLTLEIEMLGMYLHKIESALLDSKVSSPAAEEINRFLGTYVEVLGSAIDLGY